MLSGGLEIGTLAAFLLDLRSLFNPIRWLSEVHDNFQSAIADAKRVGTLSSVEPAVHEAAAPLPPQAPRREVRLDGVHFGCWSGDGERFGRLLLAHLAAPPARRWLVPAGGQVALGTVSAVASWSELLIRNSNMPW
jgi:ABC-type multidrug transport system fused ATPase/permease subunit